MKGEAIELVAIVGTILIVGALAGLARAYWSERRSRSDEFTP